MPERIIIYGGYDGGIYEIGNSYWFATGYHAINDPADTAGQLRDAQALIQSTNYEYTRWEFWNSLGVKSNEGSLSGTGVVTGEYLDIKYAYFLRFNSTGGGRPSTKFVHGLPESLLSNGELSLSGLTAMLSYAGEITAMGVVDSDGADITGVTFRSFSRRRRIRRKV